MCHTALLGTGPARTNDPLWTQESGKIQREPRASPRALQWSNPALRYSKAIGLAGP